MEDFNWNRRLYYWLTAGFITLLIGWYCYQCHTYWTQKYYIRCQTEHSGQSQEHFIQSRLKEAELIWSNGVTLRHKAESETPVPDGDPWTIVPYRTIWDFFYPNFNCPHSVERIGRIGDGGKWVCGISQLQKLGENCVVYSYGISGDTTFEQEILNRTNCSLHAYDHTIRASRVPLPELYPSRATFSNLGLGAKNSGFLRTLKSEMNSRGHTFIDILKVDVEGAEFESLEQTRKDFPNGFPFGQLLIELHLGKLRLDGLYKVLRNWWESLEGGGLRAFHGEVNLYALSSGRRRKPTFCEVSFLNVKIDHGVLHA